METKTTPNQTARQTIEQIELSATDFLLTAQEGSKDSHPYLHIRRSTPEYTQAVWELYDEPNFIQFSHLSIVSLAQHTDTKREGRHKGKTKTLSSTLISFDSHEPNRTYNPQFSIAINHYDDGKQFTRLMVRDVTNLRERGVPVAKIAQFSALFHSALELFNLQETLIVPDVIDLRTPQPSEQLAREVFAAAA